MIKRDRRILKLLRIVNTTFGSNIFTISDRWDSLCDIGLKKDNKLIYVSTFGCKVGRYFYQCEILLETPDKPYIAQDTETNVPEEQLLEVMSKFFEIEFADRKFSK